jgi:hypothetical protein
MRRSNSPAHIVHEKAVLGITKWSFRLSEDSVERSMGTREGTKKPPPKNPHFNGKYRLSGCSVSGRIIPMQMTLF